MTTTPALHGGLVFSGKPEQALNRFCHIASAALEKSGHQIVRLSVLTGQQARVNSEACLIKLRLIPVSKHCEAEPGTRPTYRLELSLAATAPGMSDTKAQERLLLTLLYNMVRASRATHVEWLSPDTRLPAKRFMETLAQSAPQQLTPALMPKASPLILTHAYMPKKRDPQPDQTLSRSLRDVLWETEPGVPGLADIQRLASRALSFVMSPAHQVRGEGQRLLPHVTTVAALFCILPF